MLLLNTWHQLGESAESQAPSTPTESKSAFEQDPRRTKGTGYWNSHDLELQAAWFQSTGACVHIGSKLVRNICIFCLCRYPGDVLSLSEPSLSWYHVRTLGISYKTLRRLSKLRCAICLAMSLSPDLISVTLYYGEVAKNVLVLS